MDSNQPVRRIHLLSDHTSGIGGGEAYTWALARALAERWDVNLLVGDASLLPRPGFVRDIYGVDLEGPRLRLSVLSSVEQLRAADLFINLSHFRVLPPLAPVNILAVFFPQLSSEWVGSYDLVLTISRYSADWIARYWGLRNTLICQPSVAIEQFSPAAKQPFILSVGRFFECRDGNNKNHPIMISAFRHLCDQGLTGWKLVLVGGSSPEHAEYLRGLKATAEGYPVEIVTDASFATLQSLYGSAAIYWHAAGLAHDGLTTVPSSAEHFGITIIEAMASGAVPVIADVGGAAEIVTEGADGLKCRSPQDLATRTAALIRDPALIARLSRAAVARSRDFSFRAFARQVHRIVDVAAAPDPLRRAGFFLRQGNLAHAEVLFGEAVDRYPDNAEPFVGLAGCAYRAGRREVALAMWRRALEIEPGRADAPRLKALVDRVEHQRRSIHAVRSGAAFGEDYFERGPETGLSQYQQYSGEGFAARHAEVIASSFKPATCLEIGCAKGDFVREMRSRSIATVGTDVSWHSLCSSVDGLKGSALAASTIAALPFADASFDLVVAIEVFEHVPPEQVDAAIRELRRVCRRFLFVTVQNTDAAEPEHFFADLTHVTMKPKAWWRERFARNGFRVLDARLPLGEFMEHQIVGVPQ